MESKSQHILLIDDDILVLQALKDQLYQFFGSTCDFELCQSGEEALEVMTELISYQEIVPVVICDYILGGITGSDTIARLYKHSPKTKYILLTGHADLEGIASAINNGSLYRFVQKPWDATDLRLTLTEALHSYQTDIELGHANSRLKQINSELEQKILERTEELSKRNRELDDGIKHAQLLQQSLFPSLSHIQSLFNIVDYYTRPYGQVSGDFIWIGEKSGFSFIALGDCTGHGLSGAFLSIMHMIGFEESLRQLDRPSPTLLLDQVNQRIENYTQNAYITDLKSHLTSEIVIICQNNSTGEIQFASNGCGLMVKFRHNGQIVDLLQKTMQHGIGNPIRYEGIIDTSQVEYIAIFTDGIVDQFGGFKGKKLKKSGLVNWFQNSNRMPFNNFMTDFMLETEQIDDMTLVVLEPSNLGSIQLFDSNSQSD